MKQNLNNNKFKELNRFLHEKGLYREFYYNFWHCKPSRAGSESWQDSRMYTFNNEEKYTVATFINYGFIWAKSFQGHDFWKKIMDEAEILGRLENPSISHKKITIPH